jgi:hypothetical protein
MMIRKIKDTDKKPERYSRKVSNRKNISPGRADLKCPAKASRSLDKLDKGDAGGGRNPRR